MGGTPKTALPPQDRLGALSALRIKFATGRTSASLLAGFLLNSITTGYTLKHDKEHL
ncbi:MAG: hypothetical protein F6K65_03210 [Moorea sp. SIO3C2]|nr:hypothetical protein [Moorena sp. SIO3C2]